MRDDHWLPNIRELLIPGGSVTCAVSGGADSMALLWSLRLLQGELGLTLRCAHFNHKLRAAADDDEAFVRDFCRTHGIAFVCGTADVAAEALPGESLELAARRLRYAYLMRAAAGGQLATAHTADDNLETMLLRLTRGASVRGMGGIPAQRGSLIRPILFATREQVLAFLAQEHIPFREDETNATDFCPRNRIRHHVVPLLRQENPQIAHAALTLSRTLREEDAYLSHLAAARLAEAKRGEDYDCTCLRALPPVLYRRALFAILQEAGVESPGMNHYLLLHDLVTTTVPSARASFPGHVVLARRYDLLGSGKPELATIPPTPLSTSYENAVPEAGVKICCRFTKKTENLQNSPTTFLLSCDMIDLSSLHVRSRQAGDVIRLSGGSRSLKRLMIDKKIPASRRASMPVLADRSGVIAVYGIGADLRRLARDGEDALQIQIEKEDCLHES